MEESQNTTGWQQNGPERIKISARKSNLLINLVEQTIHPIIRTFKENLVLHVAGTKSVKGKEKSMFSVSPQAARYTAKKDKKRFNFPPQKKTALNTYLNKIKLNCLVQYEF